MKQPPQRPKKAEPTQPIPLSDDDPASQTPRQTDPQVTQDFTYVEDEVANFLLEEEELAGDATHETNLDDPKAKTAFEGEQTEPPAHVRDTQADSQPQTADKPAKEYKVIILGDFHLLKKLGAGGMGSVYKAHQVSLDRDVAVKVLAKHLATKTTFLQRFLREARVMARLDHPNILRCFGVGEERGLHYYVMDYVEGGSVDSWLRKLGRIPIGDALHIALACARALEYAHENQLVHRDIKPENVLLTSRGVVKVADMGLVKALSDDMKLTESGVGAGTPFYMAPEQFRSAKHADARSDIYSLGCMLYHLLTGHVPFTGESHAEILDAKEKGKSQPSRRFNTDVPPRLDLILDKTMAKDPNYRYLNCTELIADLEGLGLANATLTFLPPTGGRPSSSSGIPTAPRPATRPAPQPSKPVPRVSAPASAAPRAPAPAAPMPPREGAAEAGSYWYVSLQTPTGDLIKRKLTEAELHAMVKRGEVHSETPASRELEGSYRALGSFKEFESKLRKQRVGDKAKTKGEKFRDMYKKLDQEERSRRRWRWFRNLFITLGGWVKLLIWLAVLAGVAVGMYYGVIYGLRWMGNKGDEFQNREDRPVNMQPKQQP